MKNLEKEEKIIFKTIRNSKENLEKLYNLRKDFYGNIEGYNNQEIWHDFDENATHIVGTFGQEYVAAITIIKKDLPVEKYLNIDYFKSNSPNICEITKLVIDRTLTTSYKDTIINLVLKMCKHIINNKFDRVVISVSEYQKRNLSLYKNIGFERLGSYYHPQFGHTEVESLHLKKNKKSTFTFDNLSKLLQQRLVSDPKNDENTPSKKFFEDSIWQISFRYLKKDEMDNNIHKSIPPYNPTDYDPEIIEKRRAWLSKKLNINLYHLGNYTIDEKDTIGNIENLLGFSQMPIGIAGPLRIRGQYANGDFYVPMATTEGSLVASYQRGMLAVSRAGGAHAHVG